MLLWFCIGVRIVANPCSNVFQKLLTRRPAHPLFIIGITHGLLSLLCVPVYFWADESCSKDFLQYMILGTFLTVSGNVLIVQALKRSDLSVLGPINSYKPIVSLIPAIIWLDEYPGVPGLIGIALILLGSRFLLDKGDGSARGSLFKRCLRDRGIQYRFAALILSGLEAVVMKKALLISTPLSTFVYWSVLGSILAALVMILLFSQAQFRREGAIFRNNKWTYFLLTVTTGLMQFCTIITFASFQVGAALALFQVSTIIAVFLGWKVFREPHFLRRLAASAVMLCGAVCIILERTGS